MTTILLIKSVEQQRTVREAFDSVVDSDEPVHFLRLPTVRCLGPLIQEINPMIEYGVEYTIDCLPEGYDVSDLVEFAVDVDADRICIGISDRTVTGKARIDDLMQSLLLYEELSGDIIVGEDIIALEELEYET
jgi:hypothetical protein